jgi:hypothetical protein
MARRRGRSGRGLACRCAGFLAGRYRTSEAPAGVIGAVHQSSSNARSPSQFGWGPGSFKCAPRSGRLWTSNCRGQQRTWWCPFWPSWPRRRFPDCSALVRSACCLRVPHTGIMADRIGRRSAAGDSESVSFPTATSGRRFVGCAADQRDERPVRPGRGLQRVKAEEQRTELLISSVGGLQPSFASHAGRDRAARRRGSAARGPRWRGTPPSAARSVAPSRSADSGG